MKALLRKLTLAIVACVAGYYTCLAQKPASEFIIAPLTKGYLNVTAGSIFSHTTIGEVGVGLSRYDGILDIPFTRYGYNLSFEAGHSGTQWLYGPKLSYTYSNLFLNSGLNFIYYRYGQRSVPYLQPQIGMNFFTYIDLTYGYNIPVIKDASENRFKVVQPQVISLLIRVPFGLPYLSGEKRPAPD